MRMPTRWRRALKIGGIPASVHTEQGSLSAERLEAAPRRVGNDTEAVEALMKTVNQAWIVRGESQGEAQGMAAGIAEGRTGGKSETLARLLKRGLGPLPDEIQAHIAAADRGQLDRWLDAVLDAPTLDAVFDGTSAHR